MNTTLEEVTAVEDVAAQNALTFLNMTGDITITWDDRNAEKIKDLIRKKMAEGYVFFTMRKVVIEAIQIRRKVGLKGVDSLKSVIIDDATFDKMIKSMDDEDVADLVRSGTGKLAKRQGSKAAIETVKKATTPDEVVKSKQAVGVRPIHGG
jgi:hypothetical protein